MALKLKRKIQIVSLIIIISLNSQKLNEIIQIKDKGLNEIKLFNFDEFDVICYNTLNEILKENNNSNRAYCWLN